ncbi:hypothetical protein HDU67_002393, partial [Dinochytrium kinnereticum]
MIPVLNWFIMTNEVKRRRRIRSAKGDMVEISGQGDMETVVTNALLDMVANEPAVSPLEMEILMALGWFFLREGYCREAHLAFQAGLEIAEVMDRWISWAKGSAGVVMTSILIGDFEPVIKFVEPRIALFRLGPVVELKCADMDEIIIVLLASALLAILRSDSSNGEKPQVPLDLITALTCRNLKHPQATQEEPPQVQASTDETFKNSRSSLRKISPEFDTKLSRKQSQGGQKMKPNPPEPSDQCRTLSLDGISVTSTKLLASAINFLVSAASNDFTAAAKAYATTFEIGLIRVLTAESKRYRGIPSLPLSVTTILCGVLVMFCRIPTTQSSESEAGSKGGLAMAFLKSKAAEHRNLIKFFRKFHGIPDPLPTSSRSSTSSPSCHLDALSFLSDSIVSVMEAGLGKPSDRTQAIGAMVKSKCEEMGFWGIQGGLLGGFAQMLVAVTNPVNRGADGGRE